MALEEIFMIVLAAAVTLPVFAVLAAIGFEIVSDSATAGRKERKRFRSPSFKSFPVKLARGRRGKARRINRYML